jgi:signal transduction histidine kinase/DNA-binding response OmpR family regulator
MTYPPPPASLMSARKQSLGNGGLLVLALWIPLMFTLILACLAHQGQRSRDHAAQWVLHTVEVKDQLEQINSQVMALESSNRGFLITGDPSFLDLFHTAQARLPEQCRALAVLISDNPRQVANTAHLRELIDAKLAVADATLSLARQGDFPGAFQRVKSGQGKRIMDEIRTQINSMESEEDGLLVVRKNVFARDVQEQNVVMTVLVAVDIALIFAVTLLMHRLHKFRRHVEREMALATEAAELSNRSKSQFLANMSHEIRTPLNGIIGTTELMFSTPLNREQRDFIETVHTSGENLLTIINDILDYSKIEFDKMELDFHPFNLLDLINEVVSMLSYRAIAKSLNIVYLVDYDLPVHYIGDATRLRQILVNLVSNGIKFTEKGEITIEVCESPHSDVEPQGVQRLVFRVSDSGIGIPPDRLNRLFKVFSQVDASTTRKYGGTGLGLAICQKLVEFMHGTIRVESTPGEGSSFTFDLPLQKGEHPGSDLSDNSALKGKRILIVDDIANNRRMLALLLARWGMEPVEAVTGLQALALIREAESAFDAALVDFQMPDMDGVMLAREINRRETVKSMPLILISSQTGNIPESELRQAGFMGVLAKPVRQNLLRSTLLELFTQGTLSRDETAVTQGLDPSALELKRVKILVADDNELNHRVTNYMLARLGYEADYASNGLEAVSALQKVPYDIILMDVQMPEMDGLEATRQIRLQFPDYNRPRIIALTASALKGEREKCLDAGMNDYLSKPVKIEALKEILRQARQPDHEATVLVR